MVEKMFTWQRWFICQKLASNYLFYIPNHQVVVCNMNFPLLGHPPITSRASRLKIKEL